MPLLCNPWDAVLPLQGSSLPLGTMFHGWIYGGSPLRSRMDHPHCIVAQLAAPPRPLLAQEINSFHRIIWKIKWDNWLPTAQHKAWSKEDEYICIHCNVVITSNNYEVRRGSNLNGSLANSVTWSKLFNYSVCNSISPSIKWGLMIITAKIFLRCRTCISKHFAYLISPSLRESCDTGTLSSPLYSQVNTRTKNHTAGRSEPGCPLQTCGHLTPPFTLAFTGVSTWWVVVGMRWNDTCETLDTVSRSW